MGRDLKTYHYSALNLLCVGLLLLLAASPIAGLVVAFGLMTVLPLIESVRTGFQRFFLE